MKKSFQSWGEAKEFARKLKVVKAVFSDSVLIWELSQDKDYIYVVVWEKLGGA